MSTITLNFASSLLKNLSHLATYDPHLVTTYQTLYPILDKKVMSMTTLDLVPRLLKMLSHIVTSYHVLQHLVTLYPPSLIEN